MITETMNFLLENYPFLNQLVGGVPLWLWIVLPVSLVLSYGVARAAVTVVHYILEKLPGFSDRFTDTFFAFRRPVSLFLSAALFSAIVSLLPKAAHTNGIQHFTTFLFAISLSWMLLVATARLTDKMQQHWVRKPAAAALIPLFRKLAKAGIVIVTFLFLLQNWGFDIAAMLAALGIGGVAIALASQKSVENLFGGIVLSLDQPIRVGEFGKYGDLLGVVIDIGLRSTRIRTLQNTIVSIPNAEMANLRIENFGPRHQILFNKFLNLNYETTIEQVQLIQLRIQEFLDQHEKVTKGGRIRLSDFNGSSQVMEIWAYIDTQDWEEFLQLQEMFLLAFKQMVEECGASLSHPSQALYVQRMSPPDEKKRESVGHKVEQLRQEHKIVPIASPSVS